MALTIKKGIARLRWEVASNPARWKAYNEYLHAMLLEPRIDAEVHVLALSQRKLIAVNKKCNALLYDAGLQLSWASRYMLLSALLDMPQGDTNALFHHFISYGDLEQKGWQTEDIRVDVAA